MSVPPEGNKEVVIRGCRGAPGGGRCIVREKPTLRHAELLVFFSSRLCGEVGGASGGPDILSRSFDFGLPVRSPLGPGHDTQHERVRAPFPKIQKPTAPSARGVGDQM